MKAINVTAVAALLVAPLGAANSQGYPAKPVRLVVGGAAGGASGTAARLLAEPLGEAWKQQVVIENRPGNIPAAEIVAKATPDGHTLMLCAIASHGIAPVVHKKLAYDHIKDFAPISRVGEVPNVLIVNPSIPVKSVKELVAHARSSPGKLQYGSVTGNSGHLGMEWFKSLTGVNITYVALKPDQPTNPEVMSGRLAVGFNNLPGVLPFAKDGKVRALGVSSLKRNARLPDVPTIIESGIAGFEVTAWAGVCAPSGVPKAIIAKVNADVVKAVGLAATRQRADDSGMTLASSTPEQFAAFIKSENAKWTKAAKDAGIQPK